ncbi:MAG: hypothetical protein Q9227_006708 [Pyrenula ochraceoflavens]
MAKEKSKEERKREKKEKKLAEEAGVKKSKKKEKTVLNEKVLNALENESGTAPAPAEPIKIEEDVIRPRPVGALVPFANPLADEKCAKRCFRSVKKAAGARTLRRGVKEVVKSLRKTPLPSSSSSTPASSKSSLPPAVVVLAADISPLDVISHLPVLCEDHAVPYVYVTSRAELGIASGTKRPTSVVMVVREKGKKREKEREKEEGEENEEGEKEDWDEVYKGLVKVVEKEGGKVRI